MVERRGAGTNSLQASFDAQEGFACVFAGIEKELSTMNCYATVQAIGPSEGCNRPEVANRWGNCISSKQHQIIHIDSGSPEAPSAYWRGLATIS